MTDGSRERPEPDPQPATLGTAWVGVDGIFVRVQVRTLGEDVAVLEDHGSDVAVGAPVQIELQLRGEGNGVHCTGVVEERHPGTIAVRFDDLDPLVRAAIRERIRGGG